MKKTLLVVVAAMILTTPVLADEPKKGEEQYNDWYFCMTNSIDTQKKENHDSALEDRIDQGFKACQSKETAYFQAADISLDGSAQDRVDNKRTEMRNAVHAYDDMQLDEDKEYVREY